MVGATGQGITQIHHHHGIFQAPSCHPTQASGRTDATTGSTGHHGFLSRETAASVGLAALGEMKRTLVRVATVYTPIISPLSLDTFRIID